MEAFNTGKDRLRKSFPGRKEDNKVSARDGFERLDQYYAVASEDEVVKRFRIILRNGLVYSLPYSLLPFFILIDNQELIIKAYGVFIVIEGRNLGSVEEYLSRERLLYIRESPGGRDDGSSDVFVESITVKGEALSLMEEE